MNEPLTWEDIDFISHPQDNIWYIGYKVKVKRGIRGKAKGFVDELLIVGMNDEKFKDFCLKHNIHVEYYPETKEICWGKLYEKGVYLHKSRIDE